MSPARKPIPGHDNDSTLYPGAPGDGFLNFLESRGVYVPPELVDAYAQQQKADSTSSRPNPQPDQGPEPYDGKAKQGGGAVPLPAGCAVPSPPRPASQPNYISDPGHGTTAPFRTMSEYKHLSLIYYVLYISSLVYFVLYVLIFILYLFCILYLRALGVSSSSSTGCFVRLPYPGRQPGFR